jgi:hypothetical protein
LTAEGTPSKGTGRISCEVEFCIFYRLSLRTLRTKDVKSLTQTYKMEVNIKPLLVGLNSCRFGERPSEREHLNARKVENAKNTISLAGGSPFTSIRADVTPVSCRVHTLVFSLFLLLTLLHIYCYTLIKIFSLSNFPIFSFHSAVFSKDCCFLQTLFSCPHVTTFKVLSSATVSVTFVQFNVILYSQSSFIFSHLLYIIFSLHLILSLFMFCWPYISIHPCNETNLMHYLSSVYFVNQPLHVSGIFVANHQEVYCIYTTIGTCCALSLTLYLLTYLLHGAESFLRS